MGRSCAGPLATLPGMPQLVLPKHSTSSRSSPPWGTRYNPKPLGKDRLSNLGHSSRNSAPLRRCLTPDLFPDARPRLANSDAATAPVDFPAGLLGSPLRDGCRLPVARPKRLRPHYLCLRRDLCVCLGRQRRWPGIMLGPKRAERQRPNFQQVDRQRLRTPEPKAQPSFGHLSSEERSTPRAGGRSGCQ